LERGIAEKGNNVKYILLFILGPWLTIDFHFVALKENALPYNL